VEPDPSGVRRRVQRGRRTAQIASVLARHGLGHLAALADVRRGKPDGDGPAEPIVEVGRSAAAAAELGPTFVRVAQLAARRVDVLSVVQRAQLAAVETAEPPLTAAELAAVLGEQIGAESARLVHVEGDEPIAHTATTWTYAGRVRGDTDVQLTVWPIGISARVELDLAIAGPAVRLLARRGDGEARLDLVATLERMSDQVRNELDLSVAARILDRAAAATDLGVPLAGEVMWDLCAPGLLTVAVPPPGDPGDETTRCGALAAFLLTLLVEEGIVVMDLAGAVDRAPLRLSRPVASAALPSELLGLLRRLVVAIDGADDDAVVGLLAAAALRRAGPLAVLDAGVRPALTEAQAAGRSTASTLAAIVAAAGGTGTSFDDLLLFAITALVELEDLVTAAGASSLDSLLGMHLGTPAEPATHQAVVPVRRPAERTRTTIGLVLSGGVVRGAAHVGAIAALADAGVRPDLVVGTSAGAVVGALLAAGHDAAALQRIVSTMRWSSVARPVPRRLALFDTSPMETFLDRYLGSLRFEDLLCPFGAVACDLATGERVIIDSGPLGPALRASTAIPGAFAPVEIDGRLLVDGGVVDNVPIEAAYAMGADYVVAIDVSAPIIDRRPTSVLDVLSMASSIMTKQQERGRRAPDVLIRADLAELASVGDIPAMQDRAREAAEEQLPRLLADLASRDG
jgi:NTE family protein